VTLFAYVLPNFCFVTHLPRAALGGLVVSVLATGHSVAGSNPTEGGGFLGVVKIPSEHFLQIYGI
jgi:hypothetical protein